MESQSDSKGGNLEVAQFDPSLSGFLHPLLQRGNASDPSRLMIYSEVSHDRCHWWVILGEDVFQCSIGVLIGGDEGRLFCADLEAHAGELVVEISVCVHRLLCHLVRAGSCCVKSNDVCMYVCMYVCATPPKAYLLDNFTGFCNGLVRFQSSS